METHAMSLIRSGYAAAKRWGLLAVLFSALLALSLFHSGQWVSILTLPLASQNFGRDMTEVPRPQCSTPMLSPILRQDRNCGGITQPPSTVSSKAI